MDNLTQTILDQWEQFVAIVPRIFLALVVLIIFYFLGKSISKTISVLLRRTSLRKVHESFFQTFTVTISLFFGLIIALNVLGLERLAVSILAGGGVTAVVLGFAFREIGENFLAGIFLAFSSPFKTGDTIKTEDTEGRVVSIDLRNTHLRTDDGRDVYVPSSQLFNRPVTNFTKDGLRRISFTVGIDYSNDSKQACALLKTCIQGLDGVLDNPVCGAYIQDLGSDYVEILVYFWVDVFNKSPDVASIRTNVLDKCRVSLLEEGYIVSSETTENIAITSNST